MGRRRRDRSPTGRGSRTARSRSRDPSAERHSEAVPLAVGSAADPRPGWHAICVVVRWGTHAAGARIQRRGHVRLGNRRDHHSDTDHPVASQGDLTQSIKERSAARRPLFSCPRTRAAASSANSQHLAESAVEASVRGPRRLIQPAGAAESPLKAGFGSGLGRFTAPAVDLTKCCKSAAARAAPAAQRVTTTTGPL